MAEVGDWGLVIFENDCIGSLHIYYPIIINPVVYNIGLQSIIITIARQQE